MAVKPRISTSQAHSPLRYVDLEPSTEFHENQDAHFLVVHLTGFTRDHIKITFVNFNRMLNVSGERPIDSGDYRWIRFNQSYPVPQNCEVEKLEANVTIGILQIKMPKKLVSQQIAQEKGPFNEESKPDKKAQEDAPPKPTTTRVGKLKPTNAQGEVPEKYTPSRGEEPKPDRARETYTPSRVEAQEQIPQKYRIPRGRKEALEQKTTESQKPVDEEGQMGLFEGQKHKIKIATRKPKDEIHEEGLEEIENRATVSTIPLKQTYEKDEKGREIMKEVEEASGKLPSEPRKPEKMFKEKEIRTRREAPKIPEKDKETTNNKENIVETIGKGVKHVSASASQVFSTISEGKWRDEDKPTLVNMGAAILVVTALSAYVSYMFASSG